MAPSVAEFVTATLISPARSAYRHGYVFQRGPHLVGPAPLASATLATGSPHYCRGVDHVYNNLYYKYLINWDQRRFRTSVGACLEQLGLPRSQINEYIAVLSCGGISNQVELQRKSVPELTALGVRLVHAKKVVEQHEIDECVRIVTELGIAQPSQFRTIDTARLTAAGVSGKHAGLLARMAPEKAEATAAEEAKRPAEAKAADEAKRAAEAKAAEQAKRAVEAKAADDAKRAEEAKHAAEAKRAHGAQAQAQARAQAQAQAPSAAPQVPDTTDAEAFAHLRETWEAVQAGARENEPKRKFKRGLPQRNLELGDEWDPKMANKELQYEGDDGALARCTRSYDSCAKSAYGDWAVEQCATLVAESVGTTEDGLTTAPPPPSTDNAPEPRNAAFLTGQLWCDLCWHAETHSGSDAGKKMWDACHAAMACHKQFASTGFAAVAPCFDGLDHTADPVKMLLHVRASVGTFAAAVQSSPTGSPGAPPLLLPDGWAWLERLAAHDLAALEQSGDIGARRGAMLLAAMQTFVETAGHALRADTGRLAGLLDAVATTILPAVKKAVTDAGIVTPEHSQAVGAAEAALQKWRSNPALLTPLPHSKQARVATN